MKRVLLALIKIYRTYISPMTPPTCRFHPTCSAYALHAIEEHGVWRGSWYAIIRIVKCGPWHRGGYDPVPRRLTYNNDSPNQEGNSTCCEKKSRSR